MNITRQPLLMILVTLAAMWALLIFFRGEPSFAPEQVVGSVTLLGRWISEVQSSWPRAAWGVWVLLHTVAALTLGRIGLRHNLYGSGTLLAIPLYGVVAVGIFLGQEYLLGAVVGVLLARLVRHYATACRNGYAFNALFRASLYLGLLPLLYPAALPLVVLALVVMLLFHRTLRELIVVLCGLLLPMAAACYLCWAFGGALLEPLFEVWYGVRRGELFPLFDDASVMLILQLVVLLAALLLSLFYYLSDIYVATSKQRAIFSATIWCWILTLVALFTPGASAVGFVLLAVPTALLLPLLFLRLSNRLATGLYLLVLLLFILRLFW